MFYCIKILKSYLLPSPSKMLLEEIRQGYSEGFKKAMDEMKETDQMSNKVFIVVREYGEYSDMGYEIEGVFHSYENAENYILKQSTMVYHYKYEFEFSKNRFQRCDYWSTDSKVLEYDILGRKEFDPIESKELYPNKLDPDTFLCRETNCYAPTWDCGYEDDISLSSYYIIEKEFSDNNRYTPPEPLLTPAAQPMLRDPAIDTAYERGRFDERLDQTLRIATLNNHERAHRIMKGDDAVK